MRKKEPPNEEERAAERAILKRLKQAAEDSELNDIAELLARKWRDDDSPHGEFWGATSPSERDWPIPIRGKEE